MSTLMTAADAAFKKRDERATWGSDADRGAAVVWHWRGFQDGAVSVEAGGARAVQVTHCLDLWMALGLDDAAFDGYYERNGYAETWAALMDALRVGLPLCGAPTGQGPCVLRQHAGHVHYAADDVGRGEPLPARST